MGPDSTDHRPIRAPRQWLLSHVGLSRPRKGRGRRPTSGSLQLTPMIDMFIVVLIFLLMIFGAGTASKAITPSIKPPLASMVDQLSQALVVTVTQPERDPLGGVVTLEGSAVAAVSELRDDSPDWLIAKLREQLEVHKHNWKLCHPDEQFEREVIVLADRDVDFKVIKKVFYTCGVAGYSNVQLAVNRRLRSGG
jgi:biopolymer transport protein ExbD